MVEWSDYKYSIDVGGLKMQYRMKTELDSKSIAETTKDCHWAVDEFLKSTDEDLMRIHLFLGKLLQIGISVDTIMYYNETDEKTFYFGDTLSAFNMTA